MGLLRPASARYSTETLSRRCRLQLLRQLTCHSATEGLVYGPRQFELTARRHAPCTRSGMLSGSRGPTGRLPHTALGGELRCSGAAPRAGRRGNLTWMATRRCLRLRRARFRDAPFSTRPRVASRALLLSQAGPHATRAFTAFPTSPAVVVPSAHLRVLLLRRLRLPLPCAPRTCSCHGRLDQLGDHRSACATSGFLASRALPLEHAVARVCREAGAQVARNVRVSDMNIDVPVSDARRIEVVANGLPLWHGAQLAIDATVVSPVTRTGSARPGRGHPPRVQRWSGMLAVAAMRAYAASLLELPPAGACVAGEAPELHEILADVRGSPPPTSSRLPAPTSHAA